MARRSHVLWIIGSMVLIGVAQAAYRQAIDSPYRISSSEARRRLQAGEFEVVLDVRTDLERKNLGFQPNSLHIEGANLETQAPEQIPDRTADILVQCNSGQRARKAAEKLHALGQNNTVQIATPQITLL